MIRTFEVTASRWSYSAFFLALAFLDFSFFGFLSVSADFLAFALALAFFSAFSAAVFLGFLVETGSIKLLAVGRPVLRIGCGAATRSGATVGDRVGLRRGLLAARVGACFGLAGVLLL